MRCGPCPHLGATGGVGAQALYLRAGAANLAVASFTTDSDLGMDPTLVGEPPCDEALGCPCDPA